MLMLRKTHAAAMRKIIAECSEENRKVVYEASEAKAKHDEELRRAQDEASEAKAKMTAVVAETFTRFAETFSKSMPDAAEAMNAVKALAAIESQSVQEVLTGLAERMGMMKAAIDTSQQQITKAAMDVQAVRGENAQLRYLLERQLMMPDDTPQVERERVRRRLTEALGAPPANHMALADKYFRDLAIRVAGNN